jgi:hypothetical protein
MPGNSQQSFRRLRDFSTGVLAISLSLRRCYACLLSCVFPLVMKKSITLGKELEHGQLFDRPWRGLRAEPVVCPNEGGRDAASGR